MGRHYSVSRLSPRSGEDRLNSLNWRGGCGKRNLSVALWCNWLTRCPLKAESTGSIPVSATRFSSRAFLRAAFSSHQSVLCNCHLSGRFQERLLTARGDRGRKQGYKGSYSKELPPNGSHRYYHPWCSTRQQIQKISFELVSCPLPVLCPVAGANRRPPGR